MQYYSDWALRIAHGQWSDHLAFYGLPGYAYLLAAFYSVLGFDPFTVALVQALVFAGLATIIFRLAHRVTDPKTPGALIQANVAGWLAVLGWIFFVPAQTYTAILMPTIWGLAGFWLCVLIASRARQRSSLEWLALGFLIGVLALFAATAFILIPLVIAALVMAAPRDSPRPFFARSLTSAVMCLVGIGFGIAPAWLHNHGVAHDQVALSSHGGINLWIGNNPAATGYPKMPPGIRATQNGSMKDSMALAERAMGRELTRGEVSRYWSKRAGEYVWNHPGEWLRLAGRKLFNFWNAYQYDDVTMIARLRATGVTWPGLSFGCVACLGLAALLSEGWSSTSRRFISAAIILHMLALLPAFVTERYRLVAIPGLLVLGATWIVDIQQRLARAQFARAAPALVLAVGSALFVSARQADASLWSLDFYETGIRETQLGRYAAAQEALERALHYSPDAPDIYFALGNVWLNRGDRNRAKSYYRRALELNPRHDGVLNNLGVLALEEKRWDVAERFFLRSLETESEDPKTFYLLARARYERGDREGALRAVDQALRLRPGQREFIELATEIRRPR